jgi:SPP1 gp7 family putative phage head morphogenesis protein
MVTLKEYFTPNRFVTRLGAITFPSNIWKEEKRTPHYEMDKAIEMYQTRPMINSGVKQLARFICGDTINIKSSDPRTHDFLNKWLDMRKVFDNEVFNMAISGLVTGNIFVERDWKQLVSGGWVLDNAFNINDTSRVYLNLDWRGDEDAYWLYEVPIEVRTYGFGGENKTPKFWKINYVYGSYLFAKMIWAIPIHKSKIAHCKIGWSKDMIYGRSFLASAIDDGEILTEILKDYSVIARYRALGRKIFSIGTLEDPATPEDIDKLSCDLKQVQDEDHIILNKPLKSEPLSFTGENDPMTSQLEFLQKDMSSGIIPNYLTPWNADVNKATANEVKIPFQLEIESFKSDLLNFLNNLIIGDLRKAYPWISSDASFTLGNVSLDSRADRIEEGLKLYQANIVTLNELRDTIGMDTLPGGDVFYKDIASANIVQQKQSVTETKAVFDMPTAPFTEQARITYTVTDDGEWLKKAPLSAKIINPAVSKKVNVNGRVIRLIKSEEGYSIWDGATLMKSFEPDEKKSADAYFDNYKENKNKALEDYYENDLPEHEVMDDFFDEVKRLNAEIISDLFKEIPKSKVKAEKYLKEQMVLGKDILPKMDGIFDKFNDRISDIVNKVSKDLLGISIGKVDVLGRDVEADEATQKELGEQSEVLKSRMTQELKSMNDKMKTDVFRQLADGISEGKHPSEIQQALKDKYASWKRKENPQDWQISRVVRTELSNSAIMMKLTKWKNMGFNKVEHLTKIDDKTGEKDRKFNHKIFDIEYLMKNSDDRIPLHPSCRCSYVAYE